MKPVSIVLAALAFPTVALAGVTVSIEQGKIVTQQNADGEIVETFVPLDAAVPGETVLYRYHVTNTGEKPAADVVVQTAVPDNMTYVSDSGESSGWVFEVSADGQSYATENSLVVYDIDETSRPAEARDIRNLRWSLVGTVAPSSIRNTTFKATLNR